MGDDNKTAGDDCEGDGLRKRKHRKPKARAHGEGSVYFEQATGQWVAAVHLGIVNGKRRRKKLRFPTQKEARRALTSMAKAIDDGIAAGDDRMTVRAFLEKWLSEIVEGPLSQLRPGTRAGYRVNVDNHLTPGLGHHTLAKLSPLHVQAFLSSKIADEKLSARTVQYIHATLRNALKHAEKWEIVSRNVAKRVDAPTVPKTEAEHLTTAQAGRVLAAIGGDRRHALGDDRKKLSEPDRLRALFSVAIAMGLRRGEITGLRWEHVDLDGGVIRVREQLQRVQHKRDDEGNIVGRGGLVVQDLKTDRSRRALRVPPSVLEELRVHAVEQETERAKAGALWTATGYVFTTADGKPIDGRNLLRRWHQALDDAGLAPMPFHASRHTAASFLLAQGADLRTVMAILGHSQIALTANLYAHVLEELHADAALRSDAAFKLARDTNRAADDAADDADAAIPDRTC
jgi:integrase